MSEVVQHTLYQVSTAAALVEGVYQGAVRVATLREHRHLGLGTFEDLDGEMVIVDGHFFQVRSDGSPSISFANLGNLAKIAMSAFSIPPQVAGFSRV